MSDAVAYEVLAALEAAADARGVKLDACSFLQLQVGAYEHERIDGPSRTWPLEIQRRVDRELAAWRKRNPERIVVCSRSFSIARQCVVEVYHVHPSRLPAAPSTPAAAELPPAPPTSPRCVPCGE